MINEIVKTHRVRVQSRAHTLSSDDEDDSKDQKEAKDVERTDAQPIPNSQTRKRSPLVSESYTNRQKLRFDLHDDQHSTSSSSFSTTSTDDETGGKPKRVLTSELTTPTNPIKIVEKLEQLDKQVSNSFNFYQHLKQFSSIIARIQTHLFFFA